MRASAGSGVGRGAARGASAWNLGICVRDNECVNNYVRSAQNMSNNDSIVYVYDRGNKQRTSAMRLGQWDEPCCHNLTTL